MGWYRQAEFENRFEWGHEGAARLSAQVDVAIIVDVLSFSTCVDVAVSRGGRVYPFAYKDARAEHYATSLGARLASTERSATALCLSPSSMQMVREGDRIVLPSPNGSSIASALEGPTVLCGCLRNARAVADAAHVMGSRILVIAAGERWENGTLRPAVEDLIGAGAILSYMHGPRSPEARAAVHVFEEMQAELQATLHSCSSGKELVQRGFPNDVTLAAELNASTCVPVMVDGAFSA